MPTSEIEEFAKIIVQQVRDRAIEACDINLQPEARSLTAKRWQSAAVVRSPQTDALIPDCVDAALFFLLNAIDEGLLRLQFTTEAGKVVDLTTDGLGELAGWYMGDEGWCSKYSAQR